MENNKELLNELVINLIKLNDISEITYNHANSKFSGMERYYILLRDFKDKLNKYSSALNNVELTEDEMKIINEKIKYNYKRPFFVSDNSLIENLQIAFDKEYKDVNTDMGNPYNMVALLERDPKSFSKLLEDHPNYARIVPSIFADESLKKTNKILEENKIFSEYMSFNDKIRHFEDGDIKLIDLDDKIFANDVYYKQIENIVNKRLENLCIESLESITNDNEKAAIYDAIQAQKSKICDKMNEKRTNYFKSTLTNSKQKIDEFCI